MLGEHDSYIDTKAAEISELLSSPGRLKGVEISPITSIVWSVARSDGEFRLWIRCELDEDGPMVSAEETPVNIFMNALYFEKECLERHAKWVTEVIRDAEDWE